MFNVRNRKKIITQTLIIILTFLVSVNSASLNADSSTNETLPKEHFLSGSEVESNEESETTGAAMENSGESSEEKDDDVDGDDDGVTSGGGLEDETTSDQAISVPAANENSAKENVIAPRAAELSDTAIIVETFAELKTFLEEKNNYTEYFLGADIVQTSGITVNTAKTDITISGTDPTTGTVYTYKDMNSTSVTNTIRVAGNTHITMKDMTIDGYNSNGPVSSAYVLANSGVYIKYDNVEYTGPQLCYAPYSTLHIKDSNIVVPEVQKGLAANSEVSESSTLILEGNTNISKLGDTSNPTFGIYNLTGSLGFKVLSGSNVNIKSISYLVDRNIGYFDVNIEAGASTNCTVAGGMTAVAQRMRNVVIGDNAEFKYYHTGTSGSMRTAVINGSLTVGNGAVLDMRRTQSSNGTLANTRMVLSMESTSSEINFNNPKRIILANGITANSEGLIRFTVGGKLNIQTNAMNLWNSMPSGMATDITWSDPLNAWNTNDLPVRVWNQRGFEPMQISAVYTISAPGNPSSINMSKGYVPATSKNTQDITSGNFLSTASKMFTLGKTHLDFNDVYNDSRNIKGESPAGSYVTVDFENTDGPHSDSMMIDSTGSFSFSTNGELVGSSEIIGTNQINFLRGYNSTQISENMGLLRFYKVPTTLNFYSSYMPVEAAIIEREKTDWSIEVEDTRNSSNTWEVYATLEAPLSTQNNGTSYTLPNALVYKTGENVKIFGEEAILIYSGQTDPGVTDNISKISWNSNEGPLISIKEDDILLSNSNYTTTIKWTLVEGP